MMENILIDEARMHQVKENYFRIQNKIEEATLRSGRVAGSARLMAVTKTVKAPYINQVIDAGLDLIGENRVQEFLAKKEALHLSHCEKHLIGHLQTNKVKQIVPHVDMIDSVGSLKLAKEIACCAKALNRCLPVLLEVNIGEEESKSGFFLDELPERLAEISTFDGLFVRGLMTIPPICDRIEESRAYFLKMQQTFIDIGSKNIDNIDMSILSMGMSGDFVCAVEAGSTMVRVGSALFGARAYL